MVQVRFPHAETVEGWAERMNRSVRHLCECGFVLVIHPSTAPWGCPGTSTATTRTRSAAAALRKKGYRLVGEVAKLLGVSENTVRRMEAEGVTPKARRVDLARGKSVRVFTAKEVERIARSRARERWRARHPGRWVW